MLKTKKNDFDKGKATMKYVHARGSEKKKKGNTNKTKIGL